MTDFLKIYENAIPDDLCNQLIDFFENNPDKTFKFDHDWRRSLCMNMPNNVPKELLSKINNIIRNYFDKYKSEVSSNGGSGTLSFCNNLESPNFLKYNNNSDKPNHFNMHSDNWSSDSSTRQISVILYLNDVVGGGETVFPYYNINVGPQKGKILMFPSFFNYSHYAAEPKSNPKYVIVTWIHFSGKTSYFTYPF